MNSRESLHVCCYSLPSIKMSAGIASDLTTCWYKLYIHVSIHMYCVLVIRGIIGNSLWHLEVANTAMLSSDLCYIWITNNASLYGFSKFLWFLGWESVVLDSHYIAH